MFQEKISGARADRPQLAQLIQQVGNGDTVLVTSLDRLARSTRDLLNVLDVLSQKGATFKALHQPMADTTTPTGRLLVGVLGLLAEFERSLIVARTTEGKRRAKAAGKKLGRKPKLTPHQQQEIIGALASGEATASELARRYNVAHQTIGRLRPQKAF